MTEPITFTAAVVTGAGRGKRLGTPTLNLDLTAVPFLLKEGIYACRVILDAEGTPEPAVMHLGPRPVFGDDRSCEIHLLDRPPEKPPLTVTTTVVERLRDVLNFPSPEELIVQIGRDIAAARAILGA